ncbi:MAG TPA: hypothetical protein VFI91_12730 [Longimicrobiaceae bacterium]|nr:hypothetical protein [Longimicrobiaceae bacterium]
MGCVVAGANKEEAVAGVPDALGEWLRFLASVGEEVPSPDQELEISVDEWVRSDAAVGQGESDAFFDADDEPLAEKDIELGLQRLGGLRGLLLPHIRRRPEDEIAPARQVLDELARAQWWTLSRLGASPLAEVPDKVVGRLDTAMALTVQRFGELEPDQRARRLELDGELWTPRKVMRRLLWLESSLGRTARVLLNARDGR